ncbi:MAG TPA: hypothetical protein VFK05_04685 [Polyangiaceae bacterium]|nr:hypothetical protein [Polyangiaceae bacterium]
MSAVLLCASGIALSGRASAQGAAPIELKWSALEGCPSEDSVLARVRKIAGTTRATANTLRAEASVTQASDGLFRLRLEIHYGNLAAVRNIEGKSCKDLAGATAVALALLLSSEEPLSEGDLAGTSPTSTGSASASAAAASGVTANSQASEKPTAAQKDAATTSPPNSTTPADSSSNTEPEPEPGPPRRWHVLLMAPLGSLSFGPMGQVSSGLGGGVGYSFDRWRFLAEGRYWAPQHETTTNLGYEYDVEMKRFTVGARGCRAIFGERFEFAPCALMSVHHLSARGSGHSLVPGTDAVTWAAVGIGAQSRFLITPWLGVVAALDGEVEFARPEVSVSLPPAGTGEATPEPTPVVVERLAPVAATLTIGAQWIF